MKIRQFELFDADDDSSLICWLPDDARLLKTGVRVTLKGMPDRTWFVTRAYKTVREDTDLSRHWKVGGIK